MESVKIALSEGQSQAATKPGEGEVAKSEDTTAQKQTPAAASQEDDQGKAKNPAEALSETAEGGDAEKAGEGVAEGTPEGAKSAEQQEAEKATGLDLTKFSDEFATNGKLSDESYKELEAKGFPRDVVDTYAEGVVARRDARLATLAESVGGVDNYNAVMKWGSGKLTEAEKVKAVELLSGKDAEAAKTYLAGLHARFVKENGKAPGKVSGGGSPSGAKVFASRSEQAAAMRDPRYGKDRAYTREVEAMSIRSFSTKNAKKRTKKAASKNTHRRARAEGRR